MKADLAMMWHHHPLMLIILLVLCAALGWMLIRRLFQWVMLLILIIAVYSIFMVGTGKKTKDQLWKQGKANTEKIWKSSRETVKGDSVAEKPKQPSKRHHSPKGE
jgi:uncharacterized membrane protein